MDDKRRTSIAIGLTLGVGVGVALGAAMGNIGLGIPIGLAIGLALGSSGAFAPKEKEDPSGTSSEREDAAANEGDDGVDGDE